MEAFGWFQTYVGAVVLTMPMVATRLTARYGPTAPFKAAIGISSLHLAGLFLGFKETLPKDQRRTYSGFVSPFDCYKLFTNGSALATTTLQQMCQWFVEAKNLADINAVIGLNDIKWDAATLNSYSSAFGFGMFLAGPITTASLSKFGAVWHTRFTQMLSAALYIVRGTFISSATAFGTIPLFFWGGTHSAPSKADATTMAKSVGMAKGELNGYASNIRAVMAGAAPYVYASVYASGGPSKPYYVAALAMFMAQVFHNKVVQDLKAAKAKLSS